MDTLSTPTTTSSCAYQTYSFDDISITSSTTDEFFDADSFIYNPTSAPSDCIASYKTEKSVISINSRTNHFAPPRDICAGTELLSLRLTRGSVSLDVEGASVLETDFRDESEEATKTARIREWSMEAHHSGPRLIQEYEASIDYNIRTARFCVLSIGRSGFGEPSLIDSEFGINAAQVAYYRPGDANIRQEFVSPDNQVFVLHDSKGVEPGDLRNFDTVRDFVLQRSRRELPLSERIHALWFCTETPTAGGRVFETGDEKLLQFAHKNQVPILIVFTRYDRLVRTKEAELRQKYPDAEATVLRERSREEARGAFGNCLKLLKRSMERLKIPMPFYATTSVRPGHWEDVSDLVEATRYIVKERLKNEAWMLWAMTQRESLPVKIDVCVNKGITYYRRALTGSTPELGQLLLSEFLGKVHEDIISCWDFDGEVLNSPEFQQLVLCLVQGVHTKPTAAILPDIDTISQFVTLVTATSTPILPPVTILGMTNVFVKWFSTAVLEEAPSVQRLLIAYTVDLICILRELLDITLISELDFRVTWTELQEALKACERFGSRQHIHYRICSELPLSGSAMTTDGMGSMIHDLLRY